MGNPRHRTTAGWFWLGVSITAGLGFMIGLLSYTGQALWVIVLMAVLGSLCFSKAAYDLHLFIAPHRIGTPVRTALVLVAVWGGMGVLGWKVWLVNAPVNGLRATAPDEGTLHPLAAVTGDTFPLLEGSPRPYEKHSYSSFQGNLKARLVGIADQIDAYRTDHPEPPGPPSAVSAWNHARSEDFRENILESVVDIHDELKWFHYSDPDFDGLLQIESYKEQINEDGGMSDDLSGKDTTLPKHKVDASSDDLDKIAKRLRVLADQVKNP